MTEVLARFPPLPIKVPWLIGPGTNTTSISACAGMDLPQPTDVDRDYSRFTNVESMFISIAQD